MHRFKRLSLHLSLQLSLGLAVSICALACGKTAATRTLVLLHTNDEHSHLLGFGPEADDFPPASAAGSGIIKGGASRRSALLTQQRAAATAAGAASLTVSAGDNLMGTLTQVAGTTAAPDYRVMKMLGYDVTTFGNHEFDYGPGALALTINTAVKNGAMPPVVASNIHFSGNASAGDATLAALFDESGEDSSKPVHRTFVVTAANGLKVGFVGLVGADAATVAVLKGPVTFSIPAASVEGDTPGVLAQIYDDLQPLVNRLHAVDKVDLVVALSHGGLSLGSDGAPITSSEDYQIAQHVSGLDVIVSGHTHTEVPAIQVANLKTGQLVTLQQAGRYGDNLGKITLTVDGRGKVALDKANSSLIKIDDTIVASDAAINLFVGGVLSAIETTPIAPNFPSFVQLALDETLQPATPFGLPSAPGQLAFYSVGSTAFDIDNSGRFHETELLDLIADAQLVAADSIGPTNMAAEAAGVVRVGTLEKGKTGNIGFADVFRTVALGASPVNQTLGYPLCRFALYLVEVKAAFEVSAAYAYAHDDKYLVPSGMSFEYDTTRAPFDPNQSALSPKNGRVTKISMASKHTGAAIDNFDIPLFDVSSKDGWLAPPLMAITVATNLYVASFAALAGAHLKDVTTGAILASPAQAIVHRNDGSEIKEWEALGAYLHAQGATLPERYHKGSPSSTLPRRAICSKGPLCQ